MLQIKQIRYSADNFSYIVHGKQTAVAIDPGAVKAICTYLDENDLQLSYFINTHMHPDHTSGNREISARTKAEYIDNKALRRMKVIPVEQNEIAILPTPGHTDDSLTFHIDGALITGDTLFNGTVGNCFSGDLEGFYHSIKKILQFHQETRIYAGHDYVRDAMNFARTLEPENPAIDAFLSRFDPYHVYSTLAEELAVNPYLRFNENTIEALLETRGLPAATPYERWHSLMSYY